MRFVSKIFFGIGLLTTKNLKAQEVNIALHKAVQVTSTVKGSPAENMVDGIISRTSKWQAANSKAPHIVEIDLKKYYSISSIKVHSGILDSEKKPDEQTQAAGFWSVKNFKLQYWDDANWSDFPSSEVHENRLVSAVFNYASPITTYKIRLVCDDGEPISIMEIEAFGKELPNMPQPPAVTSSIQSTRESTEPRNAMITVTKKVVGKSMKYVGYNQGYYMPGSNISGWVEYSGVNAFRVWATMNAFVPEASVQVDKTLTSVEEFDKRKESVRSNPENNKYIKWNDLLPLYDQPDSSSTNGMVYSNALKELKRLGVDVILQCGSTDFKDTWENKWKQWQRYYALAYYSAKTGDVAMFAMTNEPNHRNAGPMKLEQWISGMQIVSDAIHCAVEDVNKRYGKGLVPKFVGPVTAGNNPEWWSAVAKNIRTDYHGKKIDHDLLQVFSTHSYNSPAIGYENRIQNIQKIIKENHPAGDTLPIVYTEIGRWMNAYLIDKEETMDDPSLFTEWAGIYTANTKNGGYGMFAFKFANTASGAYPRGIKSGHHLIWQGKRIVEDSYVNIAKGKKVMTSNGSTTFITDDNKHDNSTWISDSTDKEKWVEIDLGAKTNLGSAVIYTGSDGGVYTAPDRIKDFKLQYWEGGWKTIESTEEKDNKYAQVFDIFKDPIATTKVRLISTDNGRIKIREIKLFEAGKGPTPQISYDVSGIQRTGEVVRLFAKGFKNEKPLLQTTKSTNDRGLDAMTSYDSTSGNYYMWLVQRGSFNYHLTLNTKALGIPTNATVTAQTVSSTTYGEVAKVLKTSNGSIRLTLKPRSVVLVTISTRAVKQKNIIASDDATVQIGKTSNATNKLLEVALNAERPSQNKVAYMHFNTASINATSTAQVLLKINGYTDKRPEPYRLHVYAIPGETWKQNELFWNNAPLLDKSEAWLHGVGTKSFVAGEIAFSHKPEDHYLDVSDIIKKHPAADYTFVVIRETRQIGDDEDKGKSVFISSFESDKKPELLYWAF